MFLIFGFDTRKGGEITVNDRNGRRYTIFFIANCFTLFFIPIFSTSKVFYISVGSNQMEITKDEYKQMKDTGCVLGRFENMSSGTDEFRQAYEASQSYTNGEHTQYANDVCPVCKNKLESSFAFCPYCGQKQPKA